MSHYCCKTCGLRYDDCTCVVPLNPVGKLPKKRAKKAIPVQEVPVSGSYRAFGLFKTDNEEPRPVSLGLTLEWVTRSLPPGLPLDLWNAVFHERDPEKRRDLFNSSEDYKVTEGTFTPGPFVPSTVPGAERHLNEDELRRIFESTGSDPTYKFKRSRRGGYINPAKARDWKMFVTGYAVGVGAKAYADLTAEKLKVP